jgi:crotonyl-CoA reductase
MSSLSDALLDGATSSQILRTPVPEQYLAAHLLDSDVDMFSGVAEGVTDPGLRARIGAHRLNPLRGMTTALAGG